MSRSSKEHPIAFGFSLGNEFVHGGGYPSRGLLAASMLPPKLYAVSPGAATHQIVHISDERVSRLEKEVAELRAQLLRQNTVRPVALTSLGGQRYRLRQPLWVELDSSGEGVTSHVSDLEVYGVGATEYEALEDLRSVLLETFDFLVENEADLGPAPSNQLQRFRDLLESL